MDLPLHQRNRDFSSLCGRLKPWKAAGENRVSCSGWSDPPTHSPGTGEYYHKVVACTKIIGNHIFFGTGNNSFAKVIAPTNHITIRNDGRWWSHNRARQFQRQRRSPLGGESLVSANYWWLEWLSGWLRLFGFFDHPFLGHWMTRTAIEPLLTMDANGSYYVKYWLAAFIGISMIVQQP